MKKYVVFLVAALLAPLVAPRAAHAEGVNFMLQLDPLGLWGGRRVSGLELRSISADFFDRNEGGFVGFKTGFQLREVELYFDYKKAYDDNRWKEAWYAGMLGIHDEFRLDPDMDAFGFIAVNVGYGAGTEGPITDGVSNLAGNLTQRGIVAVLRLGPEYYVNRWFAIGLELNVGYHYLWLGGAAIPDGTEDRVQGIHYGGLLFAKLLLGSGNEEMRRPRATAVQVNQPVYQGPVYQQNQPYPQQPVYPQPSYQRPTYPQYPQPNYQRPTYPQYPQPYRPAPPLPPPAAEEEEEEEEGD